MMLSKVLRKLFGRFEKILDDNQKCSRRRLLVESLNLHIREANFSINPNAYGAFLEGVTILDSFKTLQQTVLFQAEDIKKREDDELGNACKFILEHLDISLDWQSKQNIGNDITVQAVSFGKLSVNEGKKVLQLFLDGEGIEEAADEVLRIVKPTTYEEPKNMKILNDASMELFICLQVNCQCTDHELYSSLKNHLFDSHGVRDP
uniref:Uncharacterized protein n=1 Tax=Ditylenchus dipsaci TaxID=166011 RepID=A0A915E400_9BILA